MAFDPKKKENKPFLDYMGARRALIIDSSSANRSTIRKLLNNVGVKGANVDTAEDFKDASEKIEKTQPQLIFTDYDISKVCGLDLLPLQRIQYKSRLDTGFFVTSEKNSPAIASRAAEEDVDALIVRPFSYQVLEDKFIEVMKEKIVPTPYLQAIEAGRQLLEKNEYDSALQIFLGAKKQDPKPFLAFSFEGVVRTKQGEFDLAQECFEQGLKFNPTHYRSLIGLFDLLNQKKHYKKAYDVGAAISKNYPISPKRLPDFVRVSVMSGHFGDILNFYEVFSTLEESDEMIQTYVSAGLVICGKYFLRSSDKEQALAALRKATAACRGKVGIIREVVITLMQGGLAEEAKNLLATLPTEIRDTPEMQLIELEDLNQRGTAAQVIETGTNLINRKMKIPRLYEIVIAKSIESKRRKSVVQELISEALMNFPEKKEEFENYRKLADALP